MSRARVLSPRVARPSGYYRPVSCRPGVLASAAGETSEAATLNRRRPKATAAHQSGSRTGARFEGGSRGEAYMFWVPWEPVVFVMASRPLQAALVGDAGDVRRRCWRCECGLLAATQSRGAAQRGARVQGDGWWGSVTRLGASTPMTWNPCRPATLTSPREGRSQSLKGAVKHA